MLGQGPTGHGVAQALVRTFGATCVMCLKCWEWGSAAPAMFLNAGASLPQGRWQHLGAAAGATVGSRLRLRRTACFSSSPFRPLPRCCLATGVFSEHLIQNPYLPPACRVSRLQHLTYNTFCCIICRPCKKKPREDRTVSVPVVCT